MKRVTNFRDLGGLLTSDGQKLKEKILFRSGHLDHLKGESLNDFLSLKIKTVVDLRSVRERPRDKNTLPQVQYFHLPINFDGPVKKKIKPILYKKNAFPLLNKILKDAYIDLVIKEEAVLQQIFDILLDSDNYPILFHCRAGKDRTGFVIAMILLALGVSKEKIFSDYLLSNKHFLPKIQKSLRLAKLVTLGLMRTRNIEYMVTVREEYLEEAFKVIQENFSSLEEYLESCGLTHEKRSRLKSLILENK